jgi:hypothetical protein
MRGRPTGVAPGCDAPWHLPPAGKELASTAVSHPPPRALRPLRGRFRRERIAKAVGRLLDCGNYTKGIARIQCTNPKCKADCFRPFSCKVFHLCPSCSQKRTLLFGEYVNERFLLRLPHRQMVFTFPKVLRVFFRHYRNLFGEVSRLVYRMIQSFFNEAAGRRIQSAAVIAYASAGDFVRFNPHLHGIFLEGGFDRQGRFVHVPSLDLARLARYFRAAMVAFFLHRSLISERLARSMLEWIHSGFSVDLSVKIPAASSKTREALAQYIARPPISLSKMLVEKHEASVLYRSEYNPYFKTNVKLFPALEFLVQLLQHLPDPRAHLVRRYGLYSHDPGGHGCASPTSYGWPPRDGSSSTRSTALSTSARFSRIPLTSPSPPGSPAPLGRDCWPRSTRWMSFAATTAAPR